VWAKNGVWERKKMVKNPLHSLTPSKIHSFYFY
jgi:hypothetical protein